MSKFEPLDSFRAVMLGFYFLLRCFFSKLHYLYLSVPHSASNLQMQMVELSDHWVQYRCPEPITSLTVCDQYVVCTDSNEKVYYSDVGGLAPSWSPLDYKASSISLSSDGSIVWVLNRKTVFALVNPSKKGKDR